MQFYSAKTGKLYNTIKECSDAEKEWEAKELEKQQVAETKAAKRKEDAAKVEEAYKKYMESQKATDELYKQYTAAKSDFIKVYGGFHLTDSNGEVKVNTISDMISDFFDLLNLRSLF